MPRSENNAQNTYGIRPWQRSILGYAHEVGVSRGYAAEVRGFFLNTPTHKTHLMIRFWKARILAKVTPLTGTQQEIRILKMRILRRPRELQTATDMAIPV